MFSGCAMVLMLPCDDGDPRVELALLLIDLLPPEAREALPWRPQHTWEEEAGGRQRRRSRVHPHLAMQPPSSYSPYSLLTLLLLLIYCSSPSQLFLPLIQLLLLSIGVPSSQSNFHTMGGRCQGAEARAREVGHIIFWKKQTLL